MTLACQTRKAHCCTFICTLHPGIGKRTAFHLAKMGCTVIMACRSKERAEAAKSDLVSELHSGGISSPKLEFMALDLCDTLSVRHFVKAFKAKYDKLDILCNNAGLNSDGLTAQGMSVTWAANFQGHFLLTNLLYDTIKKTPNARVINLASMMHHFGSTEWHKSALGTRPEGVMRPFYARSPYADTKMAMVLLTQVCDSLLYILIHFLNTHAMQCLYLYTYHDALFLL
jgi:NAD(P)-dependent dehydrogenase (short-subunit alcohol dehydrogenase family)